ncbi:MAG: DUF2817 domain-containing protein [Bacteriovoracaceae bacterium]
MKYFLLAGLFSLSFNAFASIKIAEEIYVPAQSPEVVRELLKTGSVIVDHVSSEGFELYGETGLKNYLDQKGVLYIDAKDLKMKIFADYPTHEDMTKKLQAIAAKLPGKMKLFSIGKSVKGKDLWVMKISDNVDTDETEPEFKYISSMHGDEIVGRELMVNMIDEIANKYGKDKSITELVDNTEIFIMPSMNPDGSLLRQRANANGVDLNRNFPDWSSNAANSASGAEIENRAVMAWHADRQFALSANFHGGSIVVNYPWDSTYDRHPMDAFLQELSSVYAQLNPEMRNSTEFHGGITDGADWYVVKGGMQDWSIFYHNDMQVTIELSNTKWPSYTDIPNYWKSNHDSMFAFMKEVHRGAGVKLARAGATGTVAIKQTSPVAKDLGSYSFKNAEFYKVLPEGEYDFIVTEKNGSPKTISVRVEQDTVRSNGNYSALR